MKNRTERRCNPRLRIALPVVIKNHQVVIDGKTVNISVGGSDIILFKETPEIGDEFQMIIKSFEDHEIPVTCRKIWSDRIIADEGVCKGLGVHFTKIPPSDQEIIASMVIEYCQT